MSKTHSFWVYPCEDHKWRVRVYVVPSQKCLKKHWEMGYKRNSNGDNVKAFFRAITVYEFPKKGRKEKTGWFGEMFFNAQDVDVNTVAHECGHAAHRYCKQRRFTKYRKTVDQEVFCYALGALVDHTLSWFLKHKFRCTPHK